MIKTVVFVISLLFVVSLHILKIDISLFPNVPSGFSTLESTDLTELSMWWQEEKNTS